MNKSPNKSKEGRRHRGELRTEILDAADELLFAAGDSHSVSIDDVVEAVGCSPPALYHYFPSKEALLLEVCARQFARFAEELDRSVGSVDNPIEELLARGHAYLDWAIAHPEHYRILFMTSIGAPRKASDEDAREAAGIAELIDNLERAIAAGYLMPGEPLQMALMLWSTVHGMASLVVANPTIPTSYAHTAVDMTGRAVLAALAGPDNS